MTDPHDLPPSAQVLLEHLDELAADYNSPATRNRRQLHDELVETQRKLAARGVFPDTDRYGSRGYWDVWVEKALQGPCPKCGRQRVVRRRNDPALRPATWCCDRCWNDTVSREVTDAYHAAASNERLELVRTAARLERAKIRELLEQRGVGDDVLAALDDLDPRL